MATRQQQGAMDMYSKIMGEIRLRIDAINQTISGSTGLLGPLAREFSFLQLRMICELIALGSLTAHGDIPATQTKKLQKEWSADKIISALAELHPNFYPEPMQKGIPELGVDHHFVPLTNGYLTRDELISLVGRCGDNLHRGNIRKLLSTKSVESNFSDIVELGQKICNLLSIHRLSLFTPGTMFLCTLTDERGLTHVVFAEPA